MMRFQLKTFLLGAVIAATPIVANVYNDCCLNGDFYGSIEALYWKPSHCPIYIGRRTGPDGNGIRPRENLEMKGDYEWGVRARVGYEGECYFVDVGYLYVRPTNTVDFGLNGATRIALPGFEPQDINVFARSRLAFRYQNVDVRYGHFLHRQCGCTYYAYGNARWAQIDFESDTKAKRDLNAELIDRFVQECRFDGGGLGVGVGGHYDIGCGFGAGGRLGIMAIIGEIDVHRYELTDSNDDPNPLVLLKGKSSTCIIPALEFRFSIDYSLCWGCWTLNGEVGYELDYYVDAIRHNAGAEASQDVPDMTCFNVGFGGPYIRVSAAF